MNLLEKDVDEIYHELQELKKVLEEYAVQDIKDLDRRLRLADKYSELQEEINLDLVILFEALNSNEIWYKNYNNEICKASPISVGKDSTRGKYFIITYAYEYEADWDFEIKDYGVTWALTKEELE